VNKRILLYSDYCKYCDDAKKFLEKDLSSGNIVLIDIEKSKEGKDLARLFGGVPTLLEKRRGELYELQI
jgi:predicted DCC family thiol-disulfide oxidoreductase YuxK